MKTPEQKAQAAAYLRDWRAKNRDKANAYMRAYRKAHPEQTKAAYASWYERNGAAYRVRMQAQYVATGRRHHLRKKFGITPEQYAEMLHHQNGGCAICLAKEPGGRAKRHFHVDHDHETGAVRGLLCDLCNRGLGYFRDRPDLLQKAAGYLTEHKKSD